MKRWRPPAAGTKRCWAWVASTIRRWRAATSPWAPAWSSPAATTACCWRRRASAPSSCARSHLEPAPALQRAIGFGRGLLAAPPLAGKPLDQAHRRRGGADLALMDDVDKDIARHRFGRLVGNSRQILGGAARRPHLRARRPGVQLFRRIAGFDRIVSLL